MVSKHRNMTAILAVCLIGLFVFGCTKPALQDQANNTTGNATIANPASVYCVEHGGTLTIVTAADGSQSGMCAFADGSQCDEWAYYRGECAPSGTANQTVTANASGLDESDFIVVDDSMPTVFSNEQTAELPQEPQ
ncbi:Uncharacterised protein [uncultured archaeon]|nr:Uncharacterised protein [uncultured archaeon]